LFPAHDPFGYTPNPPLRQRGIIANRGRPDSLGVFGWVVALGG
jgi:hypothetical protein